MGPVSDLVSFFVHLGTSTIEQTACWRLAKLGGLKHGASSISLPAVGFGIRSKIADVWKL